MNTILDTDPPNGKPIPEGPLYLLKIMYLQHPVMQALQEQSGWSDTRLINVIEGMRRDGLVKIVVTTTDGAPAYSLQLTPSGNMEAWLAEHADVANPSHTGRPE